MNEKVSEPFKKLVEVLEELAKAEDIEIGIMITYGKNAETSVMRGNKVRMDCFNDGIVLYDKPDAKDALRESFKRGLIAGVTKFAIWKDGEQIVGVMGKTLSQAIKEIEEGN